MFRDLQVLRTCVPLKTQNDHNLGRLEIFLTIKNLEMANLTKLNQLLPTVGQIVAKPLAKFDKLNKFRNQICQDLVTS